MEERSCNDFDCPLERTDKASHHEKPCIGSSCLSPDENAFNSIDQPSSTPSIPKKCLKTSPNDLDSLDCTNNFSPKTPPPSKSPSSPGEEFKPNKPKSKGHKCPPKKPCKTRSVKDYLPNRKVTLKVGGNAIIYKGDTLKIRCPRPKMPNGVAPKVTWYKNSAQIFPNEKYHITKKGALIIRNVTVKDDATFSCSFGSIRQTLMVNVRPSKPQNSGKFESPPPSLYDLDHFESSIGLSNNRKDIDSVDEPEKASDTSQENSQEKISLDTDRLIKSDSKPSLIAADQRNYQRSSDDSLRFRFDDNSLWNVNDDKTAARSSASSNHQNPLSKFTNFFRQNLWQKSTLSESSDEITLPTMDINEINRIHHKRAYYLPPELQSNLTFYWMVGDWSNCTEQCGGQGFQVIDRSSSSQSANFFSSSPRSEPGNV